jgi:hypothetical protein
VEELPKNIELFEPFSGFSIKLIDRTLPKRSLQTPLTPNNLS